MGRRCAKHRQECIYSSRARRAIKARPRPKAPPPAKKPPRPNKAPGVGAIAGTPIPGGCSIKRRVLSLQSVLLSVRRNTVLQNTVDTAASVPELVLQQYERIENRQKFRYKYLVYKVIVRSDTAPVPCALDYTQLCFIARFMYHTMYIPGMEKKKKNELAN